MLGQPLVKSSGAGVSGTRLHNRVFVATPPIHASPVGDASL